MHIHKEDDRLIAAIGAVIDETREWLSSVIQAVFYPESLQDKLFQPSGPEKLNALDQEDRLENLATATEIHTALQNKARVLIDQAGRGVKPAQTDFTAFLDMYDSFSIQMRRLQQDLIVADFNIDPVSGLRNVRFMKDDLAREMERQARRGKPFCLVLAQIDDFEEISRPLSPAQKKEWLSLTGDIVKKCLRSFDDAYFLGQGEFLLALKQTGSSGGFAAIDRLQNLLSAGAFKKQSLPVITMSFCAAEPVPGDDIDEMLNFMREDLGHHDKETGSAALEFFEQSPLERMLKTGELEETQDK